jgi:hypothetical protein
LVDPVIGDSVSAAEVVVPNEDVIIVNGKEPEKKQLCPI